MPFITRLPALTGADPYPDALLALDFVGARRGPQYYKALGVTTADITKIPGWTYTGGTAAGTGSYAAKADGSLQFFPSYTNLLTYSNTWNTNWQLTNGGGTATVSAAATTAPDGTNTGWSIVEGANTGIHDASQAVTIGNVAMTASAYFKANARTKAHIRFTDQATGGPDVAFDLSAGTFSINLGSIGSWTSTSATMTSVGGGWWRCTLTSTKGAGTAVGMGYGPSNAAGAQSYTGDGTSGIYIWGAQLELGSTASTYIPTTTAAVTVATPRITDAGYWAEEARTNSFLWSSAFDNAAWTKSGAVVTANQTTAPDGTLTADLLTNTPSVVSSIYAASSGLSLSTTYTRSIYVALAPGNTAPTFASAVNKGAGDLITNFNMSTLAITGTDAATSSITPVGGGWYRISHTFTTLGSGSAFSSPWYPGVFGSTALAANFYIWGAQLELGSFATSPIPTTSVAVTRAADVGYVSGLTVPMSAVTMLASFDIRAPNGADIRPATLSDGTSNNRLSISRAATDYGSVFASAGGAYQGGSSSASFFQIGSRANFAATIRGTVALNGAFNGVAGSDHGPITVPSNATTLHVGTGHGASLPANGPIRRIVIYPRAFGNSELQAITTAGAY